MYTLNGWWFLSSSGAYPPVFTVVGVILIIFTFDLFHSEYIYILKELHTPMLHPPEITEFSLPGNNPNV